MSHNQYGLAWHENPAGFNAAFRRLVPKAWPLLVAGLLLMLPADAQSAASRLMSIGVDNAGMILLNVTGEGFDPLLSMQSLGGGRYRIVLQGENVVLDSSVQNQIAMLQQEVHGKIPAVMDVSISQVTQQHLPGVRVVLDARQKLQPQVRSNTGNQITIALVGNHALPAGIKSAAHQPLLTTTKTNAAHPVKPVVRETNEKEKSWERLIAAEQLKLTQSKLEAQKLMPKQEEMVMLDLTEFDKKPEPVKKGWTSIPSPEPYAPLRLKSPPPGYRFPSSETPDTAAGETVYRRTADSGRLNESLYALVNSPQASPAIQTAWKNLLQGDTDAAERGLRSELEAFSFSSTRNEAEVRYFLAQVLLHPLAESVLKDAAGNMDHTLMMRRESARQELLRAVSKNAYLPAYLSLMDMYMADADTASAEKLWDKVTGLYPDEPRVWCRQGRLKEALNDLEGARQAYLRALSQTAEAPEIHYRLAQVELKAGRPEAARWELHQGIMLSPDDARFNKLLGYIAQSQNDSAKAARLYKAAVQPDALINYGRMLMTQNQPQKGLAILEAVESMSENDPGILFNLGMIYAELHRDSKAQSALTRFIALGKDASQDGRIAKAKSTLQTLKTHRKSK